MQCPDCGYMMTAFEKECPRCKALKAKGLPTQLPARRLPETVQEPTVASPPVARPLRVVTPGREEAPLTTTEPAPLIIYEYRSVRWQPWAAAAAVTILLVGLALAWKAHLDGITKAIVLAARTGACERMPGFDTDRDIRACTQLTGSLNYTVNRDKDDHASVTFYLDGVSNSLEVSVNRDNDDNWHAVSAKEGDEGDRHEYDRTLVPTYERRPAPPQDTIGGPTVTSPPENAGPATPFSSSSSSNSGTGDGTDFTMRTEAGGGPPPDTKGFESPPSHAATLGTVPN